VLDFLLKVTLKRREEFQMVIECDGSELDFLIEVDGANVKATLHDDCELPDSFDQQAFSEFLRAHIEAHYENQMVLEA